MENKLIVDCKLTVRDDNGYIYWQGKPFTGIEVSYYDDGTLDVEEEYVDGVLDGWTKWWYENGQLEAEKFYKKGCIHGYVREWYKNGQLKREEEIYNGIAISEKHWNEEGNLTRYVDKRKNETCN